MARTALSHGRKHDLPRPVGGVITLRVPIRTYPAKPTVEAVQLHLHGRPLPSKREQTYQDKLVRKMPGMISLAQRREAKKLAKGKAAAAVKITANEAIAILISQNYRCALTGIEFWSDDAPRHSYGPMCPSFDRMKHDGPYSRSNVRIVLLGVNSMRGRGTDGDMYRIASALIERQRKAP